MVALPSQSPLVTFRIVFLTGAASDPAGKPGVAALTAAMLAQGGTREMTYKQIVDAMFPMATSVSQPGRQGNDNLLRRHPPRQPGGVLQASSAPCCSTPAGGRTISAGCATTPINFLRVSLRGNNDEELGKEVLYNEIYAGHPYGHHNAGAVSALSRR